VVVASGWYLNRERVLRDSVEWITESGSSLTTWSRSPRAGVRRLPVVEVIGWSFVGRTDLDPGPGGSGVEGRWVSGRPGGG
jgi:hypothetical protein